MSGSIFRGIAGLRDLSKAQTGMRTFALFLFVARLAMSKKF